MKPILFYVCLVLISFHPNLRAAPPAEHSGQSEKAQKRPYHSPTTPHAWLEIDPVAFEDNLSTLKKAIGEQTKICAVIKANAYGHGIELLMPAILSQNLPCLAITSNEEAKSARKAGFKGQLIRIRTAPLDEVRDGLRFDIEEMVGDLSFAKQYSELARKRGKILRYHLGLNAGGMSRGSIEAANDKGKKEILDILKLPHLKIVGIMTHFPVEDKEDIRRVLGLFNEQSDWVIKNGNLDRKKITLHAANSFASLEVPESRLDMIRPGGVIYGDTLPSHTEYKRVMTFKSSVASVNEYPKGNSVSYDRTVTLQRPSKIANVTVGYSDGYRRNLSNQAHVLIRGQRYPVIGRVTMNMIMVDVTDAPEIQSGDEVVLFGKQGKNEITQAELEKSSGTIFADLYTIWGFANPKVLKPK